MRDRILSELQNIEAKHNVKILYACESGSRAWGFASRDSDYDVRFFYVHLTDWYLSIDELRDVIEEPIGDALDINGWDLRKALRLFRKSNPPLLEWLRSPIVYLEPYSTAQRLRDLGQLVFSPRTTLYHYLHMARGNFREYLRSDLVKTKKYFYVLRPLLACCWIESMNTMPPMEFDQLVETQLPKGALSEEVAHLLERKRAGQELDVEPQIKVINDFLEEKIDHFDAGVESFEQHHTTREVFDEVFRVTLKEVWG